MIALENFMRSDEDPLDLEVLGAWMQAVEVVNETGLEVRRIYAVKTEDSWEDGFGLANGRLLSALSWNDGFQDVWALIDGLHLYFELVEPAEA